MGDVFLLYEDTGREYFRRLVFCNILFCIVMALGVVFYLVDIFIIYLAIILAAVSSIFYALYFIQKNPPTRSHEIED